MLFSLIVSKQAFCSLTAISIATMLLPSAFASAENDKAQGSKQEVQVPKTKTLKVLDPNLFEYPMKMGYESAKKHPEVVSKLFCYCGCDKADNHKSLMDCYTSDHGAYCQICLEEAIKADEMVGKKIPIREIQQKIDGDFAKLYPLAQPTPTLLKYREDLKKEGLVLGSLNKTGKKTSGSQGSCCGDHSNKKK
jgi:hypothetical protein